MKKIAVFIPLLYIIVSIGLVVFNLVYLIVFFLEHPAEGISGYAGPALVGVIFGPVFIGLLLYLVVIERKRHKTPTPKDGRDEMC